jgi:hypothetical protein
MRRKTHLATMLAAALALLAGTHDVSAQAMSSVEPFKVGTFEINGAPTVGLVLRDALIVDIRAMPCQRSSTFHLPAGGTGSRLPPVDSYRSGRGGGPGGD